MQHRTFAYIIIVCRLLLLVRKEEAKKHTTPHVKTNAKRYTLTNLDGPWEPVTGNNEHRTLSEQVIPFTGSWMFRMHKDATRVSLYTILYPLLLNGPFDSTNNKTY